MRRLNGAAGSSFPLNVDLQNENNIAQASLLGAKSGLNFWGRKWYFNFIFRDRSDRVESNRVGQFEQYRSYVEPVRDEHGRMKSNIIELRRFGYCRDPPGRVGKNRIDSGKICASCVECVLVSSTRLNYRGIVELNRVVLCHNS